MPGQSKKESKSAKTNDNRQQKKQLDSPRDSNNDHGKSQHRHSHDHKPTEQSFSERKQPRPSEPSQGPAHSKSDSRKKNSAEPKSYEKDKQISPQEHYIRHLAIHPSNFLTGPLTIPNATPRDRTIMSHIATHITTLHPRELDRWTTSPRSHILLLESEEQDSHYLSTTAKFVVDTMRNVARRGEDVVMLNWFCGLFPEEGNVSFMLRNLIGEVVWMGRVGVPDGKPPTDIDGLVALLCACIKRQLRKSGVVCFLESLNRYAGIEGFLRSLVEIANQDGQKFSFKLLLASTSSLEAVGAKKGITQKVRVRGKVVREAERQAERAEAGRAKSGK